MSKYKFASVDIGGTNTRFALIEEGKILKKIKFETNQKNYSQTLDHLISLLKEYEINALALCIPGPADYKNGIIFKSPNLSGWENLNVKQYILERHFLEAIVFENDANVMALSNHYTHLGTQNDVTQFFTVSTGLGAGLVIKNKIFTGYNYIAQEIAKIPLGNVYEEGFHLPPYSAELFASGTGIELRYKLYSNKNLKAKEIFDLYKKDPLATKIIDEGILTLAKVIATSIAFNNPSIMSFGGSVTNNNLWFVKEAINLAKNFTDIKQFEVVNFNFDQHGDDSALIGLDYLIKDTIAGF
ncbi:ROK family protein [Mycoplasmopsis ciconiae]|uniref:ROK family protein n=1 Tax=Mycoplasmopsis ciconiae TaxID=561067 RepID=A0ABU7MLT2_9BACT|nr:ROK family protein [Mycoplasmopsis ciconiae]